MSQTTDEPVDEPNQLTAALNRAPWWATLIVYFGLPSSMGFIAFLVFLGIIPSPYMLNKFAEIEREVRLNRTVAEAFMRNQDAHIADMLALNHKLVNELYPDVLESNHKLLNELHLLRACVLHPKWKPCEE